MKLRILFYTLLAMLMAVPTCAQEDEEEVDDTMAGDRKKEKYVYLDEKGKKGFMFGVNVGLYIANQDHASFYDGAPKGEGFLDLATYINIPTIKQEILNSLGGGISEFTFEGYGYLMRYNRPLMIGGNVRYQFNWHHAVVADFNFITLTSNGLWAISYPGTNGATQQIFQNYNITGKEERLAMTLGYQVALAEPGPGALHFEFGPMLTALKIRENRFFVGERSYNILRAQNQAGNQILNNRYPTRNFVGAYAQLGFNLEFDKFTIDTGWRTSSENIDLGNPLVEKKRRLQHAPFIRFVYRISVRGF